MQRAPVPKSTTEIISGFILFSACCCVSELPCQDFFAKAHSLAVQFCAEHGLQDNLAAGPDNSLATSINAKRPDIESWEEPWTWGATFGCSYCREPCANYGGDVGKNLKKSTVIAWVFSFFLIVFAPMSRFVLGFGVTFETHSTTMRYCKGHCCPKPLTRVGFWVCLEKMPGAEKLWWKSGRA